jgi:hypothetical protein
MESGGNEMRINAPLAGLLLVLTAAPLCVADVKANPEDEKLVLQVLKDFADAVWPPRTPVTFVLLKEDGKWQIASCRHALSTSRSLSWPLQPNEQH